MKTEFSDYDYVNYQSGNKLQIMTDMSYENNNTTTSRNILKIANQASEQTEDQEEYQIDNETSIQYTDQNQN